MPLDAQQLADNRADFVKRIFAVAVSVGFASQLVQQPWIREGLLPSWAELANFTMLCLGLFLVVQSWEGYLKAIQSKPLYKIPRFYIDIALVFMYLSLLVISTNRTAFLFIVSLIFFMHVLWDCVSFIEFFEREKYPDCSLRSYMVFLPSLGRRRLTTIVYFIFTVELFSLQYFSHPITLVPLFLAVIGILIGYRLDKDYPAHPIVYMVLLIPLCILLGWSLAC